MGTPSTSIGCIGTGAMGGALLCGLARPQQYTLYGYNRSKEPLEALKAVGVIAQPDSRALVRNSRYILLAVKSASIKSVIEEVLPELTPDKVLAVVASVAKMAELQEWVQGKCPVVRLIPNIAVMAGEGILGICLDDPLLKPEDRDDLKDIFSELGRVVELPESNVPPFTVAFACGPGYVYHFMEALVEAVVTLGFGRAEATELTASMLLGAAKLAVESGQHPNVLREQVCSPAGITIAAMNHLDRTAVRGHLIDALLAARDRANEMERGGSAKK